MKNILNYTFIALVVFLSSCTTGGFDENPQLDKLNDAIAKSPKVESISVNGVKVERNTVSIREIDAKIGDVLSIEVKLTGGVNSQLVELEFTRQYYGRVFGQEAKQPVDAATDGFVTLSGSESSFIFDYTVPGVDDDGFDFGAGNIITVQFSVRNSIDYYNYKEFVIHIVE